MKDPILCFANLPVVCMNLFMEKNLTEGTHANGRPPHWNVLEQHGLLRDDLSSPIC